MSRIPPELARRLDRLARRAHVFHRWAHHPLCGAYRGEVLKMGRLYLCRGCTLVVSGAGVGLVAGGLIGPWPLEKLFLATAGWVAGCLGLLIWPAAHRIGKLGTRFLPMATAGFLVVQGLGAWSLLGIGVAFSVVMLLWTGIWIYRRRGPWRKPCKDCPELDARPCSGFRRQYLRERAFSRLAGRWVERSLAEKRVHHNGREGHKEMKKMSREG